MEFQNLLFSWFHTVIKKLGKLESEPSHFLVQGDPTLSDKSNFDVMARKFGQISKIKVFSCSQMKNNLF